MKKGLNHIKTTFSKIDFKAKAAQLKTLTLVGIERFNQLDKRKKIIISSAGGVVGIVIIVAAISAFSGGSAPQSAQLDQFGVPHAAKKMNPVLMKLNNIENQINLLQSQQSSAGISQQQLNSLNANLTSLKAAVANLQNSSPQSVSQIQSIVANSSQSLSGQLSDIKTTLDALKTQEEPRHYLPASVLPWAIDGVDVRNYQPVVIRADGYGAINKGEIRDGWKLVQVQFNPPLAVFQNVNNPNDYVKVQQ